MSFSCRAFDRRAGRILIEWITNYKVTGGSTITSTKGTCYFADPTGTIFQTNAFTDTSKKCFNIELKFTEDTAAGGGGPLMVRYKEVLFNQGDQTINEAADGVNMNLTGLIYGSVEFGSYDFTSGSLMS